MTIIVPVPAIWAPRSKWRDYRDGAAPPEFRRLIRDRITAAVTELAPPLLPEDLLCLLGLWLSGRYLYPLLPATQRMSLRAAVLDAQGMCLVAAADPEFANHAGFPSFLQATDALDYARVKLERWMQGSLRFALGGPGTSAPDASARGQVLRWQY